MNDRYVPIQFKIFVIQYANKITANTRVRVKDLGPRAKRKEYWLAIVIMRVFYSTHI